MKVLSLLLLLLLLPGCGRNLVAVEDITGAPAVAFTTDKNAYTPEENFTLLLENRTPRTIQVRDCVEIDRQVGPNWSRAGHWGTCRDAFNSVDAGEQLQRGPGPLGARFLPGTYRFANEVRLQDGDERVVTEAFTITL